MPITRSIRFQKRTIRGGAWMKTVDGWLALHPSSAYANIHSGRGRTCSRSGRGPGDPDHA
jgi:hypothetical protein